MGERFPFVLGENDLASCEALTRGWKEWTTLIRKSASETFCHRVAAYDKGVRSLFDYECSLCDKRKGLRAVSDWWDRVGLESGVTPQSVLRSLRAYARRVLRVRGVRRGVDEGLSLAEGEHDIPDGNACLERFVSLGGTFSVPAGRECGAGDIRVTSVKSKGKYRVVTCQPAYVKRALHRTMQVYYNILSKNSWLVRGDVTAEHFRSLGNCGDGETFVSGDYTASTDYINHDAVMEVVAAMAEGLDADTAQVLLDSFHRLECQPTSQLAGGRVKRGSMMGSKCSFVVLCVINAFVVDSALGNVDHLGKLRCLQRPKLINGDDSAFIANDKEFDTWTKYASWVGFRVNLSKTGRSSRFVEVNSQCYDRTKDYCLPKPAFGFLRQGWSGEFDVSIGERNPSLWDALWRCLKGVARFDVSAWVLTHPLVRDALVASGQSPDCASIPRRYWRVLVRRPWFRLMAVRCSDPMGGRPRLDSEPSTERSVAYQYGPVLLSDEDRTKVEKKEAEYMVAYKKKWDGVEYKPPKTKKIRVEARRQLAPIRIQRGASTIRRLWITPVLEELREKGEVYGWEDDTLRLDSRDFAFEKWDDPKVKVLRFAFISRNDRAEFRPWRLEAGRAWKKERWLCVGVDGAVRIGGCSRRGPSKGVRNSRPARLFPLVLED